MVLVLSLVLLLLPAALPHQRQPDPQSDLPQLLQKTEHSLSSQNKGRPDQGQSQPESHPDPQPGPHSSQSPRSQLHQGQGESPPRCVGRGGAPVDWWVLLKYPAGQRAAYLDSTTVPLSPQLGPGRQGGGQVPRLEPAGCVWVRGLDVNDQAGPLRASLAAAGQAAAQVAGAAADGGSAGARGSDGARSGSGRNGGEGSVSQGTLRRRSGDAGVPLGYVFYNDADPGGVEHWGFAHAKGVLLLGSGGGVWMTHSFPSYPAHPPRAVGGVNPPHAHGGVAVHTTVSAEAIAAAPGAGNGTIEAVPSVLKDSSSGGSGGEVVDWDAVRHAQTAYGQHALCLTLPAESLRDMAESLLVARAYVYDYVLPPDLASQYGAVQDLIDASSTTTEATAGEEAPAAGIAPGDPQPPPQDQQRPPLPVRPPPPPPRPPSLKDQNTSSRALSTSAGSAWLHITKSPDYSVPFHEQVLEPLLGCAMAWETWRVGNSYSSECPPCTSYGSYNIRHVRVPSCRAAASAAANGSDSGSRPIIAAAGTATVTVATEAVREAVPEPEEGWDSLKDHSKWGISVTDANVLPRQPIWQGPPPGVLPWWSPLRLRLRAAAKTLKTWITPRRVAEVAALMPQPPPGPTRWVCVGDLNRQPSQRFRGGGYVCSADAALWGAFRILVEEVEPCGGGGRGGSSGADGRDGGGHPLRATSPEGHEEAGT